MLQAHNNHSLHILTMNLELFLRLNIYTSITLLTHTTTKQVSRNLLLANQGTTAASFLVFEIQCPPQPQQS